MTQEEMDHLNTLNEGSCMRTCIQTYKLKQPFVSDLVTDWDPTTCP